MKIPLAKRLINAYVEYATEWFTLSQLRESILASQQEWALRAHEFLVKHANLTKPPFGFHEPNILLEQLQTAFPKYINRFIFIGIVSAFDSYVEACLSAAIEVSAGVNEPSISHGGKQPIDPKLAEYGSSPRRIIVMNTVLFKGSLKIPSRMAIWRIIEERNILLHSGGRIDDMFLKRALKSGWRHPHKIGDVIEIENKYLTETMTILTTAVEYIHNRVLKKYLRPHAKDTSATDQAMER